MSVLARLITLLLALPPLALALAGLALWSTLPSANEQLAIPGLTHKVAISYDPDGIPRIKAANETDAATAIGYVHARDRLFQMELMRRAASGRLSEIVGPATLRIDRVMRVLGLRRRAEAALPDLPPDTRALLDAYARGVNAWIQAHGRFSAPEFLALGQPAPWTPVDSLLWGRTMTLYLSMNERIELSRLALAGRLSRQHMLELWPGATATPGPAAAIDTRFAQALEAALPGFPEPYTLPSEASDEWAVDGAHSATGAPILAGDPHLAFTFPGIWYLARIDWPGHVLAGATAPGVPFLVIGRNAHIAWTFTTAVADTQDLFEETELPDGRYAAPDGPRDFAVHDETIHIRGAADEILHVRETRHGPVISDVLPDAGPHVLALAMQGLQVGDAAPGLLALNRSSTVGEARAASVAITAPVQNLLVADQDHIGLFTTGSVPVRRAGDGAFAQPGADGAHDWIGSASGGRLPWFLDPPSGHLINGNERTAPPDFPVLMARDAFGDWRARRIRALLEGRRPTVDAMAAMQADATSAFAYAALPLLRLAEPATALGKQALALLDGWHGTMRDDAPQPLIFNAWVQRFEADILATRDVKPAEAGPWEDVTAAALRDQSYWCGGDCAGPLARSLDEAAATLAAREGHDPAAWRWGDAHKAVFAHPILRGIAGLSWLSSRAIPIPGDETTLFRGGNPSDEDFDAVHGASYRGVYDLGDLDRSRFMAAPGQSGNLLSPAAWSLLDRWRAGQTMTLGAEPDVLAGMVDLLPE